MVCVESSAVPGMVLTSSFSVVRRLCLDQTLICVEVQVLCMSAADIRPLTFPAAGAPLCSTAACLLSACPTLPASQVPAS